MGALQGAQRSVRYAGCRTGALAKQPPSAKDRFYEWALHGYATHRSGNANSSTNGITPEGYNGFCPLLRVRCGGHSVSDEVAYVVSIVTADVKLDSEL